MAESQSGFDMEQYKYEGDQQMSAVMPDYWLGFARMRIHERGFNPERKDKAEVIAAKLLENNEGLTGKKAGEIVIKKMDEKLGFL